MIDELRADVTKTRKDGTRGRLRIDYGNPREPEAALKWLWRFVDGAKTAGELYGRALVVIAAEQHAARMVLPASQRGYPTRWSSHKDLAAKALKKLAGPHIPASLTGLERAVKRAHSAYEKAERAQREQRSRDDQPGRRARGPRGGRRRHRRGDPHRGPRRAARSRRLTATAPRCRSRADPAPRIARCACGAGGDTRCSAATTTTRPTPRPVSASTSSPWAGSAS